MEQQGDRTGQDQSGMASINNAPMHVAVALVSAQALKPRGHWPGALGRGREEERQEQYEVTVSSKKGRKLARVWAARELEK
jgi:hypothetical protein